MLPEIFVTRENQLPLFPRDKKMPFRYWERRAPGIFVEKPTAARNTSSREGVGGCSVP